jgi:hypothetical protein
VIPAHWIIRKLDSGPATLAQATLLSTVDAISDQRPDSYCHASAMA